MRGVQVGGGERWVVEGCYRDQGPGQHLEGGWGPEGGALEHGFKGR